MATDTLLITLTQMDMKGIIIKCHKVMRESPANYKNCVEIALHSFVVEVTQKTEGIDEDTNRIIYVTKILDFLTRMLLGETIDFTDKNVFVPYHIMIKDLFFELTGPIRGYENIRVQILVEFCNAFHDISPLKCPSFVSVWLDIISNKRIMMTVLSFHHCWAFFATLLIDLFDFMAPFLSYPTLENSLKSLYNDTIHVLRVLRHDFSDFLCEYWFYFINKIPNNYIQMRNLILSSCPSFSTFRKVDEPFAELKHCPKITVDFDLFMAADFKKTFYHYLMSGTPMGFDAQVLVYIISKPYPKKKHNISYVNAVVLYGGMVDVACMADKITLFHKEFYERSNFMSLLKFLSDTMCNEGRYLLYSAIVDNLRYPNGYTVYFENVLLHLFESATCDAHKEQIIRVLVERVTGACPHPWGVLITMTALLNPKYKLMNYTFVQFDPKIQELFQTLADKHIEELQY